MNSRGVRVVSDSDLAAINVHQDEIVNSDRQVHHTRSRNRSVSLSPTPRSSPTSAGSNRWLSPVSTPLLGTPLTWHSASQRHCPRHERSPGSTPESPVFPSRSSPLPPIVAPDGSQLPSSASSYLEALGDEPPTLESDELHLAPPSSQRSIRSARDIFSPIPCKEPSVSYNDHSRTPRDQEAFEVKDDCAKTIFPSITVERCDDIGEKNANIFAPRDDSNGIGPVQSLEGSLLSSETDTQQHPRAGRNQAPSTYFWQKGRTCCLDVPTAFVRRRTLEGRSIVGLAQTPLASRAWSRSEGNLPLSLEKSQGREEAGRHVLDRLTSHSILNRPGNTSWLQSRQPSNAFPPRPTIPPVQASRPRMSLKTDEVKVKLSYVSSPATSKLGPRF